MTTQNYGLDITIYTVGGGKDTHHYDLSDARSVGEARGKMGNLVIEVCRPIAEGKGLIYIAKPDRGITYNQANVTKVEFQASSEDLQKYISDTVRRIFST